MRINYWLFINNNNHKKRRYLSFISNSCVYTRSLVRIVWGEEKESLFCQAMVVCHLQILKITWKIGKGGKVPGSLTPKAAQTRSSRGAKQRWWVWSSVPAAREAAGPSCHFRNLAAHSHIRSIATWISSSPGGRPGYSGSILCCSLKPERTASTQSVATLYASLFLHWGNG